MKNSLNLGFIALLLVVLGCSCPNLKNLNLGENRSIPAPPPAATPFGTNTSESPTKSGNASLTKANYEQIKNGMSYKQVVDILGSEGSEMSNSEIGKYKTVTYKWDSDNYSYIIVTIQNDKLMFKSQNGLK